MYLHEGAPAMKQAVFAGLVGLVLVLVLVDASLKVGDKECGEKKCSALQYCDQHGMCDNCSRICNPKIHNYEQKICEEQCQDYLHEQMYVRRGETSSGEDINSKVARLTVLVTVTLVVVVLVFLILLVLLFLLYRFRRRQSPPEYEKTQGVENGKAGTGLKITMPPPPSSTAPPPVTPATMSTPLSTRPRFPKEDPTLEYGAYDNPGLTPSPVFENKDNAPNTATTTTPVSRRQESSF